MKWDRRWLAYRIGSLLLIFACAAPPMQAQTQIDTSVAVGDSVSHFWLQVPAGYSPTNPPALLVWWHQWGGTQHEMRDYTDFDEEANQRGWLAASHFGWCDHHWNNPLAQDYATAMLGWIREDYPFDEDSLYFIGGSMGGAAGMVYHNNNCDSRGFFVAATASGSGIMDCHRRAMEYLAQGDTNRSMRDVFGGLPWEAPFEYQRNSAIYFADTTYSMHFNSQHLPVLLTFGLNEGVWKSHALDMDSVRQGWADTTFTFECSHGGHGYSIMSPLEICSWLSGFRANRYPDEISINADEADRYYWVYAEPTCADTTFARFQACKIPVENRVDLTGIRHVALLEIDGEELGLNLTQMISGYWRNLEVGMEMEVALVGLAAPPDSVTLDGTPTTAWDYDPVERRLTVTVGEGGLFRVYPQASSADKSAQAAPIVTRIVSNYPNPFNQSTCFLLEQARSGPVTLTVYNILGQEVWSWSALSQRGTHRVTFGGEGLPSGVYLYRLESPEESPIKRMVLIR
jgi:hypothetical protein